MRGEEEGSTNTEATAQDFSQKIGYNCVFQSDSDPPEWESESIRVVITQSPDPSLNWKKKKQEGPKILPSYTTYVCWNFAQSF